MSPSTVGVGGEPLVYDGDDRLRGSTVNRGGRRRLRSKKEKGRSERINEIKAASYFANEVR